MSMENPILNPLRVIDTLFAKHKQQQQREQKRAETSDRNSNNAGDGGNPTQADWGVYAYFEALMGQEATRVPSLTKSALKRGALKPGMLVRYRGMVQDTFDPEYFQAESSCIRESTGETFNVTCKFRDTINVPAGCKAGVQLTNTMFSSGNAMSRQSLFCVPRPGESAWAREAHVIQPDESSLKRDETCVSTGKKKRQHAMIESSESDPRLPTPDQNVNEDAMDLDESTVSTKQIKLDAPSGTSAVAGGSPSASTASSKAVQMPFPNEEEVACIVKIYDADSLSFPVNEVYDFVGVLSVDPILTPFQESGAFVNEDVHSTRMDLDDALMEEHMAHEPPSSMVPRLHVICFRSVAPGAPVLPCGPFRSPLNYAAVKQAEKTVASTGSVLPSDLRAYPDSNQQAQLILSNIASLEDTRREVVTLLASALGGDELAAEYLLLNLISHVYARVDDMPLGAFSLCLSHATRGKVQDERSTEDIAKAFRSLNELISQLVPSSISLNLSIASLNEKYWSPRKDMAANRLISGPLQLARNAGTVMLINESAMQQGRLNDHGCRNLRGLQAVLKDQTVEYDFVYSKVNWPVDVQAVTISAGPPLLKCNMHMPLKVLYPEGKLAGTHAAKQQEAASAVEGLLARARAYIAAARLLTYSGMDADTQKAVETEFVKARQADSKVGQDDLHEWITHARLVALSHGEHQLTLPRWQESRRHEITRKQRVAAVTIPKEKVANTGGGPPPSGFGVVPGSKRTIAPK